jgi:GNAT superfamily N-acetyltransferase
MPRITDRSAIRRILEIDRPWAVYALGDLTPGFAEHCDWFALGDEPPALVLLYRRFDPPILFAIGSPHRLAHLIHEVAAAAVSLHVRPDALAALQPRYRLEEIRSMWRMMLEPAAFRGAALDQASPLSGADLAALSALYGDGDREHERPDFFDPSMLEQGIFRGVWEGQELVAAAGTHLIAQSEGVCAIGNVYTRRDRRQRGLAARVTGAVAAEALSRHLPTIVLNVNQRNVAAIRVYERLGFRKYCEFAEGLARRAAIRP